MIEITNGIQRLTVTKGAYESVYAPQGWEKASSEISTKNDDFSDVSEKREIIHPEVEMHEIAQENVAQIDDKEDVSDYDEEDDEIDLAEIPLSEMSVPQLKAYGNQLGIKVDTDSAKTLRNRIRKALEG